MADYLVVDIETTADKEQLELEKSLLKPAANIKDPEKKAANLQAKIDAIEEKGALLDSAIIACIGIRSPEYTCNFSTFKIDAEAADLLNAGIMCDYSKTEKEMLEKFSAFMNTVCEQDTVLVTSNGYNFDLPKLRFRNAWHDLRLPEALTKNQPAKDIMVQYTKYYSMSKVPFVSVGEMAQRLGICDSGKLMKGNQFGKLIKERNFTTAILYNVIDLILTERIFWKICR